MRIKFLYKKRGDIVIQKLLIHLGMIGIAVFAWYLLNTYVKSIEENTEYQRILLSRDLALLANTLYAAPGNVEYIYSNDKIDLGNFYFEFLEDNTPVVKVKEKGIEKKYPYAKPAEVPFPDNLRATNSIKFSKIDNIISTSKNE